MSAFVDAAFLHEEGPYGFTRQLERLLALSGFTDVANVDGPGDRGADLLARRGGEDWVFQAKWKKSATVDESAVDEVYSAMRELKIDRGVVVTNRTFSRKAVARADDLARFGVRVSLWTGNHLTVIHDRADVRPRSFELHDYQERAVNAAWEALQGPERRALVFLATGLGKTVVAGRVIARALAARPDAKILVTAHMRDLVEQLERAMWRDIPKNVRTRQIHGSAKPDDLTGVVFGVSPTASAYINAGYRPDLVVVDEAHHVGETGTYSSMLDQLPDAMRVGVTATPWRGDRFDIEHTFGEPVVRVSISEGMRRGYLAKVRYFVYTDNIDWDFVEGASEKGYSMKDLNKRLFIPQRDEAVRDHLVEVWGRTVRPRAIVFCQTIEHAERMAETLRAVPGWQNTESLHGELGPRDRRERLLRFRSGATPILTSVDVLNEGVDVPDVNIICFARVTHSRRIFVQQLGRGLRLRAGKEAVEVLDFVSDIRRAAEVYGLAEQLADKDIEEVPVDASRFIFTDQRVTGLLDKWIEDVGDLADAKDSVRLEFPPTEGGA